MKYMKLLSKTLTKTIDSILVYLKQVYSAIVESSVRRQEIVKYLKKQVEEVSEEPSFITKITKRVIATQTGF